MKKRKKITFIIILTILILIGTTKIYFEAEACMTTPNDINTTVPTTRVEHKTIQHEGYAIHYFVSGKTDGELIIFLHPAFSDHRAYDAQIDYFGQNYNVITIDMIGHGLSQIDKSDDKIDASPQHINEIMEAEGYDKAHIIGVSMGSLVAQYFGVQHPQKVASLTALGGYNINKESDEVTKAQNSSNVGLMLRALFSMNAFRTKTASITAHTTQGQAMFYKSTSLYRRKSFMSMQGFRHIIKNRVFAPPYPTLILVGEHDIPLAIKMAEDWKKDLPVAEYKMINGGGHCANMDVPEMFNQMIERFIENSTLQLSNKGNWSA